MDPIEHASIPALAYLALSGEPHLGAILALAAGAVFPDLDAFTREHRSYLHSLIFALPFSFLAYHLGGLPLFFALGWLSHLFLDFFTGVIPFAYPISRKGYGVEVHAKGGVDGLKIETKLLSRYPDPRRSYDISIGGSIALLILTLGVLLLRMT